LDKALWWFFRRTYKISPSVNNDKLICFAWTAKGVDRAAVHQQISELAFNFFEQVLAKKQVIPRVVAI